MGVTGRRGRRHRCRPRRGRWGTPPHRWEGGQATVELMAALPVMIAIAVIVVNATLFLSDCAAFDRLAHQAVRVHAASPAYGQDIQRSRELVEGELARAFDRDNLAVSVSVESVFGGRLEFRATLEYFPTLGLRSEVFGVELPGLSHTVDFTVDQYKPGVFV